MIANDNNGQLAHGCLQISDLHNEAILFATLLILGYTIFFFFCFHLFVVVYEEPALRGTFGVAYKRY
jgi:protein-S-isoprenylcysteine O-methyltransferase Ste14